MKILGILWDEITNIMSVDKLDIINVMGSIPPSIECRELSLIYSEDIRGACFGDFEKYYLDNSSGVLYSICGEELAPAGYYSDGVDIVEWDGADITHIGSCGRG